MPVNTLLVQLLDVHVKDDGDTFGAGEWHLHGTVNGNAWGDSGREFTARSGEILEPPENEWSEIVDVSGHAAGDRVEIKLRIVDEDVFNDDELGEVTAVLRYPYTLPVRILFLESPLLSGGWFSDDYRAYSASIMITHHDMVASTDTTGNTRIPVTRDINGGTAFNTVNGEQFTPRVDVHPVIPVPQPPSHVPRPLPIPAGLQAAAVLPAAQVTAAPSAPALNALPNPSVIPILDPADPDFANRVANLAVTAHDPGNLDTSKLFWVVSEGPAVIVGSNTGPTIQARGTPGSTTDQQVVFEVHWEDEDGPVLAVFRAWVGKLGTLKYRVNMLDGMVPAGAAPGTPAPFPTTTVMPPATANNIMQVVKAILFQAGILLVPDDITTAWDGATLTPVGNAVFQATVTNNQHTNNVAHNIISKATRYNFRPGTINFTITHSCTTGAAAAVDRNGIEGSPSTDKSIKRDQRYTWSGTGGEKKLGGSPSPSWIKPSGVGLDGAAQEVTLKTIMPSDRVNQAKSFDRNFVRRRKAQDATFTAAKMGELYACQVPAIWLIGQNRYVWRCGINFAHELCHVLGLAHRGCAGNDKTLPGLSLDGMNFTNAAGETWGHPWFENVMCYGYAGRTPPPSHDIDRIQATVVRKHPAVNYT